MKLVHWLTRTVAVFLVFTFVGITGSAAPRVIAEVEILTDSSAEITLEWSDDSGSAGIMITGWRFEDNGNLKIYYKTGEEVPEGFAKRTISHEGYILPLTVHLERALGHTSEFTDIVSSDPGYDAILNLYYRGIIGGYPDGTFKPSNNVTRAEFSKMLLMTAGYEVQADISSSFTDVGDDYWGRPYIMTLAYRDIFKGKGEGIFDPGGVIKMGEVLTVITRTFDLYEGNGSYPYSLETHWSNEAFLSAVSDGIVLPSDSFYTSYGPDEPATREQCSVLLSRVLESLHDVVD